MNIEVREKWVGNDGVENEDFDENKALSVLLLNDVVFLNNHYWLNRDNQDNTCDSKYSDFISVNVNCSDVFAWGCAEAVEMFYTDIQEVYEYWEKDNLWGCAIWCIIKRREMPQKPVYDSIQKLGIWNLDELQKEYGLVNNLYDEYLEKCDD